MVAPEVQRLRRPFHQGRAHTCSPDRSPHIVVVRCAAPAQALLQPNNGPRTFTAGGHGAVFLRSHMTMYIFRHNSERPSAPTSVMHSCSRAPPGPECARSLLPEVTMSQPGGRLWNCHVALLPAACQLQLLCRQGRQQDRAPAPAACRLHAGMPQAGSRYLLCTACAVLMSPAPSACPTSCISAIPWSGTIWPELAASGVLRSS